MSNMAEQMARLIGNQLAGGKTLFLPEVGSLYVVQHRAKQLAKRTVRPPYKSVEFTSQEHGETLPALIARAAECDAATARAVYDRWLAQVRKETVVTIAGVGKLANKCFTPEPEFDRRLNPHGTAPVQLRRNGGFGRMLALGLAAAIVVVLGIAGAWYLRHSVPEHSVAPVVPEPVVAEAAVSAAETTDDPAPEAEPATVEQPEPAPVAANPEVPADPETLTRMTSGRHYIVMGVFSTRPNAEYARKHFGEQQPDWTLRIYLFGDKFLLACHSTDSEEDARNFVRANRNRYPDLWVHSAR